MSANGVLISGTGTDRKQQPRLHLPDTTLISGQWRLISDLRSTLENYHILTDTCKAGFSMRTLDVLRKSKPTITAMLPDTLSNRQDGYRTLQGASEEGVVSRSWPRRLGKRTRDC